jgi:hypothetical protein
LKTRGGGQGAAADGETTSIYKVPAGDVSPWDVSGPKETDQNIMDWLAQLNRESLEPERNGFHAVRGVEDDITGRKHVPRAGQQLLHLLKAQ